MMRWRTLVAMLAALLAAGFPVRVGAATVGVGSAGRGAANPICARLGNTIEASAGAQMYCFGAQQNGPSAATASPTARSSSSFAGTTASGNTDAASLSEDVTQSGARAYGQSETSVAAAGPYVVEAWNDATSLYSLCPSPKDQEEGTGLGFSIDGGRTFTDLGGLPNDCTSGAFFQGDPSVEALQRGGSTYFYVSSLYDNVNTGASDIALDACVVGGTALRCSGPIVVATSLSGFLDKDFLAIDPGRSRLYVTYTRFDGNNPNGQIELARLRPWRPEGAHLQPRQQRDAIPCDLGGRPQLRAGGILSSGGPRHRRRVRRVGVQLVQRGDGRCMREHPHAEQGRVRAVELPDPYVDITVPRTAGEHRREHRLDGTCTDSRVQPVSDERLPADRRFGPDRGR